MKVGSTALALGLALGGCALGLTTALFSHRPSLLALSFGGAGLLLIVALGSPGAEPRPARSVRSPVPRGWRLLASIGSATLGVLLLVAALLRFADPSRSQTAAWWWFGVAPLLLGLAAAPWRGTSQRTDAAPPRWELLTLAGILLVAIAFRGYRLDSMPYGIWFDEAQNALEAAKILAQPEYRPVFVPGISQMPALPFYYYAVFVELLGPNVFALRVATTCIALLSVVVLWLLGRELWSPEVGLCAAGFLAVSRWHVSFSRFAIANLFITVFIPLTLLLFLRALRRESPRYAVWAGLALGIGLQLYYAMMATPLLLLLVFAHRALRAKQRRLRSLLLVLLSFSATAFAYAPVAQYARRHPEEFRQRMQSASVFHTASLGEAANLLLRPSTRRREVLASLRESTERHAGMFHLAGDRNGRHNLPGAPMLDAVTGLCFAVGLVWCLLRIADPRCSMLLGWFALMLAAGILSVTFEAPQAARTLGNTSVVALMAALPVARATVWLGEATRRDRGRSRLLALAVPVVAIGAAGALSWRTFFNAQLWDAAAWGAWSPVQTKIGEIVRQEGGGAEIYVPAVFLGGPTETLVLGAPIVARTFDASRDLPLEPTGRRALVFVHGHELETTRRIERFYPHARLEPFGPPQRDGGQGSPVLWIARVPAADIAQSSGWRSEYRKAERVEAVTTTTESIWNWRSGPVEPPFTVAVTGALRVPASGSFRFALDGETPATIAIDGETLPPLSGERELAVDLAQGVHSLGLVFEVTTGDGSSRLEWSGPGIDTTAPIERGRMIMPHLETGGLLGVYSRGTGCAGEVVLRRIDSQISFYFHILPLPRPFSVHWSGSLHASAGGTYRFFARVVDAVSVRIDGAAVLSRATAGDASGAIRLDPGWHRLDVCYSTEGNYSQVYFDWQPPGEARTPVPAEDLRPPGPRGQRPWTAPSAPVRTPSNEG